MQNKKWARQEERLRSGWQDGIEEVELLGMSQHGSYFLVTAPPSKDNISLMDKIYVLDFKEQVCAPQYHKLLDPTLSILRDEDVTPYPRTPGGVVGHFSYHSHSTADPYTNGGSSPLTITNKKQPWKQWLTMRFTVCISETLVGKGDSGWFSSEASKV